MKIASEIRRRRLISLNQTYNAQMLDFIWNGVFWPLYVRLKAFNAVREVDK